MTHDLHNIVRSTARRLGSAAAASVLFAAIATAAGPIEHNAIVVRTVDHAAFPAELISFSIDDGLKLQAAEHRNALDPQDIVSIDRPDARPDATATRRYELTDRSALCGELIGGDDAALLVRHRWLGDVALPIDELIAIRRSNDERDGKIDREPQDDDIIELENGDRIVGTLIEVRDKALIIDTERGERAVPVNVIREAQLINPRGERIPDRPRALLSLTDGSQLVTDRLTWQDGQLEVTLRGEQASIPERVVKRIDVIGGRWVWLSDLSPADVTVTPLWSAAFPPRYDRNVAGEAMRVGGRRFDRGVGVHSTCKLRYDLGRRFAWFVVHPGIDDAAGRLADVTARVVADGKSIYESNFNAVDRSAPDAIRLDVAGVKTLELIVEYGNYGDVQDRFNWADAALIREEIK